MSEARRQAISAEHILDGGPVVAVLSSRAGLSGNKSFSVVTDLGTGAVVCRVTVDGTDTDFPRADLDSAVAFYNTH